MCNDFELWHVKYFEKKDMYWLKELQKDKAV